MYVKITSDSCDGIGANLNLVLLLLMFMSLANEIMMEGGRDYVDDDNESCTCSCW